MLSRTSNRGVIMAMPSAVEPGVGGAGYAGDKPKVRHAWARFVYVVVSGPLVRPSISRMLKQSAGAR